MNAAGSHFDVAGLLDFLEARAVVPPGSSPRLLDAVSRTGASVERAVLELGLAEEDALYSACAEFLHMEYVEPTAVELSFARSGLLSSEYLARVEAIPVRREGAELIVAFATLNGADELSAIAYHLGAPVRRALATPSTIKWALAAAASGVPAEAADAATSSDLDRLRSLGNDGPAVQFVADMIARAVSQGASDIHLEAGEQGGRIRFRVDGRLVADRLVSESILPAIVSRLKVMGNLNISERRRPQDGRTAAVARGRSIDVRMSTLPTQFGESVVLRLLDRTRLRLDWKALGFSSEKVAQIRRIAALPHGLFLVAGPTGSGKTTTLYTALAEINSDDRKIVSVEDPVEYSLKGVNQVQVEPELDMTFAPALRAILRQDPDVIMVGEIRDEETAEIAVRAAMVGRLVLSTIHTNDSISAIDRLGDLGVPRYLIAATLRGVLSQRLVRANCASCRGCGCDTCRSTGRSGRLVVSELLSITGGLARDIADGKRGEELLARARSGGFSGLEEDMRRLIQSGTVHPSEAERLLEQEG